MDKTERTAATWNQIIHRNLQSNSTEIQKFPKKSSKKEKLGETPSLNKQYLRNANGRMHRLKMYEADLGRKLQLTRGSGGMSDGGDSNFDSYNKNHLKPVHVDIETDLDSASPSATMGRDLAILPNRSNKIDLKNINPWIKTEPSLSTETIRSYSNTERRRLS